MLHFEISFVIKYYGLAITGGNIIHDSVIEINYSTITPSSLLLFLLPVISVDSLVFSYP